ncbi:MAG: DUF4258 domain-containing protein [Anaerolineae bacterium]
MPPDLSFLHQQFSKQLYLLTAHASDRAAQRNIFSHEIEEVVLSGIVIEDYPADKYGPSCLIMGQTLAGRILHIQVTYPPAIKVVTLYEPSLTEWEADLKTRKS